MLTDERLKWVDGLLGTISLLGFLGGVGSHVWFLELFRHFSLQYWVLSFLALAILLVRWDERRLRYWLLPLLLCLMVHGNQLHPYFFPSNIKPTSGVEASKTPPLKLLHMNVLKFNQNYPAVAKVIRADQPDILSLQEVDKRWLKKLNELGALDNYPHRAVHPSTENGLYSRIPMDSLTTELVPNAQDGIFIERGEGSILVARFKWHKQSVTLLNFHPATPVTPGQYQGQQRHFETLIQKHQAEPGHVIVVGDLNTTPWSAGFQKITSQLGLQDARQGKGLQPTWPAFFPLMAIPIDHVLTSSHVVTQAQRVGPFVGSDHLPIYIELGFLPRNPVK